jgi:CubicO group peptidase (beta-lactamase class C family)
MTDIGGHAEDGFGKVADAFAQNFASHGEVGGAFSLYVGGRPVVDLWGGLADAAHGRPWTESTLQLVFSTTKGATAVCANRLVDEGRLDLDAPVARYWPEFAGGGKQDLPVRHLLTHQAGLPFCEASLTAADVLAQRAVLAALEDQAPLWAPGTAHGYHALTYGWLVGEVVRRIDGRPLGRYFAEEVAGPLGLDFWIGLPPEEEARVSTLIPSALPTDPAVVELMLAVMGPGTMGYRALTVNDAVPWMSADYMPWNTAEFHAAEIPAANGITDARSLARMYAACVGPVDGVRLLSDRQVAAAATLQTQGLDQCLQAETRFGLGFMVDGPFVGMLSPRSFGHPGAGGSLGFGDPDAGVGFGYVMNQMQSNLAGDPRVLNLIEAVKASL